MALASASTGARDRSNTGKASKFLSGVIATCKIAFRNLSLIPIVTWQNTKNTLIHITTSTNPIRDLPIPLNYKPSKNDYDDCDRRGIVANFSEIAGARDCKPCWLNSTYLPSHDGLEG